MSLNYCYWFSPWCFGLQAFESELQSRVGAGVKTHSRSRHLKTSDSATDVTDESSDNLISLSMSSSVYFIILTIFAETQDYA